MTARATAMHTRIDRMMEQAGEALVAQRYSECERVADEALHLAHTAGDFERMARIVLPLQEARRQRMQAASDIRKVNRLTSYEGLEPLLTGAKPIKPGCYLIEPSLVGMDGRELRERAVAEGVPVFVLVREPQTRLGQWPIVAVGPTTVRTRIEPPKRIDVPWLMRAGEALGDAALSLVDPTEAACDRVEHLFDLLATVIDHEKLHQALMGTCQEAAHDAATATPKAARSRGGRRAAASEEAEDADELLDDEE